MVRVYVAAPYPDLAIAQNIGTALKNRGFDVTSRWLFEDSAELNNEWARKDLADVARADILLAISAPKWANSGTGGRHVELGYALALRKPVLLLGPRTNIFHHLSDVQQIDEVTQLVSTLNAMARDAGFALAG